MKQTFSNKYFDCFLIAIIIFFLIDTVPNLLNKFEYFSSYLLRITLASVSIVALISLLTKNGNGERYSRFFIIIGLILPSLIIFNLFLTDLLFYGINRANLLQNPILYLKFIIGITLFILTIKHSKQTKSDRIQDYWILTNNVGIFLISLILIRTIEPNFISDLNHIPIWKTITKSIIGFIIVYLGNRLKNEKMKLRTCIILVLISMIVYGLI